MMAVEIDPNAQTRGDLRYKIAVTMRIELNHLVVTHEGQKKPRKIRGHRAHPPHLEDRAIKPDARNFIRAQMKV
jgi:hypothetical protein